MTAMQLPQSRVLAFPAEIADVACSGAYLITREACEFMASLVLPVRVPADDWSFFVAKHALHGLRCVAPMPIRVDPNFRTTIPWSLRSYRQAVYQLPLLGPMLSRHKQRIQRIRAEAQLVDQLSGQRYEQELVDHDSIEVTRTALNLYERVTQPRWLSPNHSP